MNTLRRVASIIAIVAVVCIAWGAQALAQTPTEGEPTEPPAEATATTGEDEPTEGEATPAEDETPAGSGETPVEGETPAEQPSGGEPVVSVVVPDDELEEGDTFDAEVRIEDAERIAAFSFSLVFDPEHLTVLDEDPNVEDIQFGSDVGAFLDEGERPKNCDEPRIDAGREAIMVCVTNNPAVCEGGAEGVSGSGTLGVVPFEITGTEDTELTFDPADTSVVLDDFVPCESGEPIQVQALTEGATVNVKGDSFPWLIIIGAIAVVVAIVGGGVFALMRMRQRGGGTAA